MKEIVTKKGAFFLLSNFVPVIRLCGIIPTHTYLIFFWGHYLKQYVIYSRKSKYTGKGESVENQVEMCRHYIATHYGQAEADSALVYEDEGFSGGTLDRPQYKQMMADSKK